MTDKNLGSELNMVQRFWGRGYVFSPLGDGHVNDTFLARQKGVPELVFQRLNGNVFENVVLLQHQTAQLVTHLSRDANFSERFVVPEIVPSLNGEMVVMHEDSYWRAWRFIKGSVCDERLESVEQVESAAEAFGCFQRALIDFHPESWQLQVPNFQSFDFYREELLALGKSSKNPYVKDLILAAHQWAHEDYFNNGKQSYIHGDCKVTNLLFDDSSDVAKSIIDLDTVHLRSWTLDFADFVRSVSSSNGGFNRPLYASALRGFLLGKKISREDLMLSMDSLIRGPSAITLMLAIRFAADHLSGDVYFNVKAHGENLQRSLKQYHLFKEFQDSQLWMSEVFDQMRTDLIEE